MKDFGYVRVHVLEKGVNRTRLAHRVLMEKAIGRPLRKEELVHHKNGDRKDNRIDNLQIMSMREHTHIHIGSGVTVRCGTCGKERHCVPAEMRRMRTPYYCESCWRVVYRDRMCQKCGRMFSGKASAYRCPTCKGFVLVTCVDCGRQRLYPPSSARKLNTDYRCLVCHNVAQTGTHRGPYVKRRKK